MTKSTPSELNPNSVWRLPKGLIDDEINVKEPGPIARGERRAKEIDLTNAALREVREEGGVKAKIIHKIGTIRYFFERGADKVSKFVTFYLMKYIKDLPEGHDSETEEVSWLSFEKARKRLKYQGEKKILDKAKEILDSGLQGNLI